MMVHCVYCDHRVEVTRGYPQSKSYICPFCGKRNDVTWPCLHIVGIAQARWPEEIIHIVRTFSVERVKKEGDWIEKFVFCPECGERLMKEDSPEIEREE